MKVAVIGAGAVGSACVFALVLRGVAREIVLIDRTRERAKAVAADMRSGAPLARRLTLRDGDYADLAGAALVMITVGVNERTGGATDRNDPAGRLKLLDTNAAIYREIVPRITAVAPQAVLLVVTDPPDPLADITRRLARQDRVLSTGTYLDSLRFRVHLGDLLGVDPADVEAQILGEHGTTGVFIWSGARVAGVPLAEVFAERGLNAADIRKAIEKDVRYANITIIEGNKASQYGIGVVSARIAEMVLRDERAAIPIGCHSAAYGVTLSLPAIVGRGGAVEILQPVLSPDESAALGRSAEAIKTALSRVAKSD